MENDGRSLRHRFRDVITSEEQLRAVLGLPTERAVAKVVRVIDEHTRRFIAHAPFVFVASTGTDGMLDVSPKGDPAGFVKVLDERTLAIPDRPGNRRLDTFRNVLGNPNVELIFVIPGVTYTLRMAGKAIIVRDAELREAMAINGKLPEHTGIDIVGRYLDELVSAEPDSPWMGFYRQAYLARRPLLGSTTVPTSSGAMFTYEFGIFPLRKGKNTIDQFIALEDYFGLVHRIVQPEPWQKLPH